MSIFIRTFVSYLERKSQPKRKPAKKIMNYYANVFNYYKIKDGRKISISYTGCTLYKSREDAENNAWQEWLKIAEDEEILNSTSTKTMFLWTK